MKNKSKNKKKEDIRFCMKYTCKDCPRARKCEEEEKNYERRKNEQQTNHILSRIC